MPKLTLPKGTYSVTEAASYLAVSKTAIHKKIKANKIPAKKVANVWVINVEYPLPVSFRNY